MAKVVELSAKQLLNEETRANTFCANPVCWRRLCFDYNCSMHFCCRVCEDNYSSGKTVVGQAHGPACSKKVKPAEDAPRAALPPRTSSSKRSKVVPQAEHDAPANANGTSTRGKQRAFRVPWREEAAPVIDRKREREKPYKAEQPAKRKRAAPPAVAERHSERAQPPRRKAPIVIEESPRRKQTSSRNDATARSRPTASSLQQMEEPEGSRTAPNKDDEFTLPHHKEVFRTRELLGWLLRDLEIAPEHVDVMVDTPWKRLVSVEQLQRIIANVQDLIKVPRSIAKSMPSDKCSKQVEIIRRIDSLLEDLMGYGEQVTSGFVENCDEMYDEQSFDDAASETSRMIAVKEDPEDEEDDDMFTGHQNCDMGPFCKGNPTSELHADGQGQWCSTCLPCLKTVDTYDDAT